MIDMNLDFIGNAVVCDYPSLASITFRIMKGEELVLNYWNGDGYDWDDHFNPISDKKDKFKEIHAEFKDISFYSKHEDEEVFSDSVIAEKLKNAKIEEIHTYADFIGKENDIKLVLKQITFHFSNSSDYQFPINEDYKVFID